MTTENVTTKLGNGTPTGQKAIERFEKGQSAVRDCATVTPFIKLGNVDPSNARIDFTAKYRWPWVGFEDLDIRSFSTRRLSNGTFLLVPDPGR